MIPSSISYAQLKAAAKVINNPDLRKFLELGIAKAFEEQDTHILRHALSLHSYPVHIEEFLFSHRYLARPRDELYPEVVKELVKINDSFGRLTNSLTEIVATGGIGSAKTTTCLYTNAYQLYLLSCYKNPHKAFGMDSSSEILFIFQSLSGTLAKDVDYKRFRAICSQSHYFTTKFPFDVELKGSLVFPNRIEAKPMMSDGGALGQNVIGGLIDEVNFMAVVEESKKSRGGQYDQAKVIYDSVSRRIKTRFVTAGGMPGILCLVSSKNYPGEFTDIKIKEAESDPTIYVYDKRVWDIKPPGTFCGETFSVFPGDENRKAKLLTTVDGLSDEDRALVVQVPVEYKKSFENDMIGSLRDIAGIGTLARYPYFLNTEKIARSFGKVESILNLEEYDFHGGSGLVVYPELFRNKDRPRWLHIDLGLTGDAAGVACGYVPEFLQTATEGSEEVMPVVEFDFVLRVVPPKGDEIKFYKIREMLYHIRELGLNMKWVSFDSFQSVDSVQVLRSNGFSTGYISMDTDILPYNMTKNAFYDDRIRAPKHTRSVKEFLSLERDVKKNKIDHPPNGSKDCSDAMAGVVYGLSTRREIWGMFGVPVLRIPETMRAAQIKESSRETAPA